MGLTSNTVSILVLLYDLTKGLSVSNVLNFYIHHDLMVLVINFIMDLRLHSGGWNNFKNDFMVGIHSNRDNTLFK